MSAGGGTTYCIEPARSGASKCKQSGDKIPKGELRIGSVTTRDDKEMTTWYKLVPFFHKMAKMRKSTYRPENPEADLAGWHDLTEEQQAEVQALFDDPPQPPPKAKKRKAGEDDDAAAAEGGGAAAAAASPKKAKKVAKTAVAKDAPPDVRECADTKAVVKALVAEAGALGIKMPEDGGAAAMKTGTIVMSLKESGSVDATEVFRKLEAAFGVTRDNECACAENFGLFEVFSDLAGYAFKSGDSMKGVSYRKAAATIEACEVQIPSGKWTQAKATKLAGVGKSTATKIDEFLQTGNYAEGQPEHTGVYGKCQRLEEMRNEA